VTEVKPLKWTHYPTIKHDYGVGVWDANGPWDTYSIEDTSQRYPDDPYPFYARKISKQFATVEEAQEACFKDYESRILSCLA